MAPEEIRRIRQDVLSMSRAQFAERVGVSPATVRAWESPPHWKMHRKPSLTAVKVIQQAESEAYGWS